MQERAGAWTEKSKLLNVQVFTFDTWERHFMADAFEDSGLLAIAIALVSIYSYLVLGGFSPILFRSYTAFVGILCVLVSVSSGYALALLFGNKVSTLHHIIPFLVVGIGVDDMFALVTALENLSEEEARLPIDQRMGLVRTSILILYNGGIETFLSPGDEARWQGNHHHHRHRSCHPCH